MSHTCDGVDPTCERCGRVRTLMTAGDRLDDITRARMWTRIEDRLVAPAPARSTIWRSAAIAVSAAAAAAIIVIAIGARRGDDHSGDLTVAADATLTSRLGPHTRAALVGPARLEVLGTPGDQTAVRLDSGMLLAEFEGGPGRSLRIEARDIVVEIVGTLFSVEVSDAQVCVAVAHGKVRVTSHGAVQLVTDRQQLCSEDTAPRAITQTAQAQLDRHASLVASLAPAAIPSPAPAPVTPAPPAPPTVAAISPTPIPTPTPTPIPTPAPTPTPTPTPIPIPPPTPTSSRPSSRMRVATINPTPAQSPTPTPAPTSARPSSGTRVAAIDPTPPPTPSPSPIPTPTPSPSPTPSPTPTPTPIASPTAQPAPSAEDLYRAAETALTKGDHAKADRALAQLLAIPGTSLADQALYERARIAYLDRSWAAARRHLAQLAALPSTPLAEPGHYLDCRIAVQSAARDAESCLTAYRTAFPRSPHDLDVLALLVQLVHARGGCAGSRAVRDELILAYPRSDHAAAWRVRCPEAP